MGVGINYKGVGGNRHFNLNGVPTGEVDALFKTPRRHKQLLPENFKKALHPMPTDPIAKENEGKVKLNAFDMRPDTLDKKTMPGSAVTTSMSGLCLEGEQNNPSVVGTKLYGSHGGKKGYHAFDDFDPPVEGGRVGVLGAGGEGANDSVAKAGAPFAYQIASRVVMETDDLGRKILVEYDRDVQDTALGRTHTVTGERRRIVGIINPTTGESDFLHPFKVIYDNTKDYEGWLIYLPKGCLKFYSSILEEFEDVPVEEMVLSNNPKYKDSEWYQLNIGKVGLIGVCLVSDEAESEGGGESKIKGFKIDMEEPIFEVAKIISNDVTNGFKHEQYIFSSVFLNNCTDNTKVSSSFSPFYYSVKPKEDSSTGELEKSIINNVFYFDGEEKTVENFNNVPSNGTVYLCGSVPPKDEESDHTPEWNFTIGTEKVTAPSGGRAINIKLYEFEGGEIKCDYRTTFLTLSSGGDGSATEMEVITDITGEFENGYLTLTLKKAKVKIISYKPAEAATVPLKIFDASKTVNVVSDVKYDNVSRKFTKTVLSGINLFNAEPTQTDEDVFTAVQHKTDI